MFGQSSTSTGFGGFGSSSANTNTGFGSKPAGSAGLFGASNQPQSQQGGGLFGSKPATTTTGMFGQQQQPSTGNTTGGLFGSNQPQQSGTTGGLFGQSNQQQSGTTGGLFGQQQQQQQNQPSTGLFGQNQSSGTTSGTGLFGQPQQQQQQPASTGGLFGQTQTNQPASTGGLFGGQQQSTASGGLFGNKPSGGLFGQSQPSTATSGGLFGSSQPQQSSTTSGGLFGGSSTTGGLFGQQQQQQQQQQPQAQAQQLQLTAMTRVGDLPTNIKSELEQFDKYINTQHLIATTLNSDYSKHDNLINSIPKDINYLQNKLLSTKQALKFDSNQLLQLKELNNELTEDINNIMHLILQLSTPGTKLSSSFQLNEFFIKKIKKYHEILTSYEKMVSELDTILSGLEKSCNEGFGNLFNIVDVIKAQYGLFMELCETLAQLHNQVNRITK
ncbi:uncharacterized protein SPAPADRAFT_61624 [Spathaspora passalidarum NRRL Y-27907]|uniref:Uncharacterized protein n=1 Tax=Spathaspora passalidarum (strain NRRL Y-27907 / 11-Y1) TaxID=619300 RepID=G3ANN1_SPAPN|nr:uncharacterized protein SPAPADRAFT_61624 [Spathaspora passalidarum NRRL Y-27907]EGW32560.1 hypothetical protein SPAPADRAFT_61624 [Spathaspora passalidarum NRRL Y-27907]